MDSAQRKRGLTPDQAAAELVEAADAICVHLYGKGHTKHYTRRLIGSALAAADSGELDKFIAALAVDKSGSGAPNG